jgi:hypothetical protein
MKNFRQMLIVLVIILFTIAHASAETCTNIKGLVGSQSPGLKFYLVTSHPLYPMIRTIYPERGEKCFVNEQEALNAGFFKLPNPNVDVMNRIKATPTPITIIENTGKLGVSYSTVMEKIDQYFTMKLGTPIDGLNNMEHGDAWKFQNYGIFKSVKENGILAVVTKSQIRV